MKCPVCVNTNLTMSERQGIEIDYCPNCRGVWLDRGELDKIIERSASQPLQPQAMQPPPQRDSYQQNRHYEQQRYHKPHKKHRSFLSELFD